RLMPVAKVEAMGGPSIGVQVPDMQSINHSTTALVLKEVRITTDPKDKGGAPLAHATPKAPLAFTWNDLQYYDYVTHTWKPFAAFGGSAPQGPTPQVVARYETRKYKNDTLVLRFEETKWPTQFALSVTVTDGWNRSRSEAVRGANGQLPTAQTPETRRLLRAL